MRRSTLTFVIVLMGVFLLSGFAVVAQEVQSLAIHSRDFSAGIGRQVNAAKSVIDASCRIASEIASKDMSRAIAAKGRVDTMLQELDLFNEELERTLASVAAQTRRMEQEVALAVRSLQFEDIARQIVEHARDGIELLHEMDGELQGHIEELESAPRVDLESLLSDVAAKTEAVEAARSRLAAGLRRPALQTDMEAGEVELF